VRKVRLTGGEPLVRRELPTLVGLLAKKNRLDDLAMTTNGVLLADHAQALKDAGLHRITISLDTLNAGRFTALTRRPLLPKVLEGVAAAKRAGFPEGIKLDTVVMRGVNDDELPALLDFAADHGAELRFIEYMDVGGATRWSQEQVVSRAELLHRLGSPSPVGAMGSAPAERFRLADGRVFGIIASTTAPFCGSCDRARLTADGQLYTCLYANRGTDLKTPLRAGETADQLHARIAAVWGARTDRGAEERLALAAARKPSVQVETLKRDSHLEMHTRGG
jgi:cyclic pyranopterin phosphate synthase